MALYQAQAATARTLTLYLDVGQNDPWLPAIAAFHQLLAAQRIPHEWHLFPGDHSGVYWSTHVLDYLLFYNHAWSQAPPSPHPAPGHIRWRPRISAE